jgi:hypothetical protein
MSRVVMALGVVVVAIAAAFALWPSSARQPILATVSVREALADDRAGFARVLAPRPMSFPEDHGPHPDFRSEWWYYTGNLKTSTGRHVGFQLTFFSRRAVSSGGTPRVGVGHSTALGHPFRRHRHGRRALPRHQPEQLRGTRASWCSAGAVSGLGRELVRGRRGRGHAAARRGGQSRDQPHRPAGEVGGASGRPRAEPQGTRARQRVALLLVHPDARARHSAPGRRDARGLGRGLDGPRVEHELPGRGPGGLGLVRAAARRRAGTDGLPAPAARRNGRSVHRRDPRHGRTCISRGRVGLS